jgi:RNA polymerase sigma-70 factor (ECF subfamily)
MPTTDTGTRPTPRAFRDNPEHDDQLWGLVAQVQGSAGESRDPFGDLYRLTRSTVYRFIRPRVGSHETTEDLVADTYLRALRRIDSLQRASASPAAWLVTIARHLVADHHKAASTRLTTSFADVYPRTPEGRPEHADAVDTTATAVLSDYTVAEVREAIKRLNPDQNEAMEMRYLAGLTVAEAGVELGKNEGAVKAMTYRATRALARDPRIAALSPAAIAFAA